jgi:hypothetical protein
MYIDYFLMRIDYFLMRTAAGNSILSVTIPLLFAIPCSCMHMSSPDLTSSSAVITVLKDSKSME